MGDPIMHAVKSRAISAIGHDPQYNELWVEFANGKTFRYIDVPPAKLKEMLAADSVGSYFRGNIASAHQAFPYG